MAGNLQERARHSSSELNMTPMVDVTFLLLIFFMVTASFSLQKSIAFPLQTSEASRQPPIEPPEAQPWVEVRVDESGSFLVLAPEWERESPSKQQLTTSLREVIASSVETMCLAVTVHESAELRSLVDCIDAASIAGFTKTRITQVEFFDN